MPRKPTPAPEAELAALRTASEHLAELERQVEQARAARNTALVTAKQAGATGDQLAAAMGIARRNVYPALRAAGYDPAAWRD